LWEKNVKKFVGKKICLLKKLKRIGQFLPMLSVAEKREQYQQIATVDKRRKNNTTNANIFAAVVPTVCQNRH
jgi:hypothetical protein